MPIVKTIEDLQKIRNEALKKRTINPAPGSAQIIIGMGTSSIAAGGRKTLEEILRIIEEKQLTNIIVHQAGDIGLDSWEPILQVIVGESAPVPYGKVTPSAARRILEEHIQAGQIVKDFLVKGR